MMIRRWCKLKWQRVVRGWSDSDTWSLDHTIAKFVLPRLKRFKALNSVVPCEFTEESWDAELDKMIAAMEFLAGDERWACFDKEKLSDVEAGVCSFGKHFTALWW